MVLPKQRRAKIPLITPYVGSDELAAIKETFDSSWLTQGPTVREFEQEIARYVGAKYAVATSSCTTALLVAVLAFDRVHGLNRYVMVPGFTFPATVNIVFLAGKDARIVDVDSRTYTMDPGAATRGMTKATGLIIPVNEFGHMADLDPLLELARSNGGYLVEDAACSLGSQYLGSRTLRSDAACFSFHPRKVITTGEGGMIVTNDLEVAEICRQLRDHGMDDKGVFRSPGFNFRLTDIQAAMGLTQLRRIDSIIDRRRKQARVYDDLLEGDQHILRPIEADWCRHSYQSYVVRLDKKIDRNAIVRFLMKKFDIETTFGACCIAQLDYVRARSASVSNSLDLERTTLTLPLFHHMTEKQQVRVIDCLHKALRLVH